jgi:hypothetical protein
VKLNKRLLQKVLKWVLLKAVKSTRSEHQLMLLRAIDPNNMSRADIELIHEMAFGDPVHVVDEATLEAIKKEVGTNIDEVIKKLIEEKIDYA